MAFIDSRLNFNRFDSFSQGGLFEVGYGGALNSKRRNIRHAEKPEYTSQIGFREVVRLHWSF
jgi:hypothetical protein